MTLDKGLGLSLGSEDLSRIESAISEHSNDFSDKILERLRKSAPIAERRWRGQ